jgi:di/tricarboxylate transporter
VLLGSLNAQQISFVVILVAAFVLLIAERIRSDIVAILIILALYLTRVLSPAEALSGFSSEPAIIVAAIFVLSGALYQTGLSDTVGRWIGRLAGRSYLSVIAVTMPMVALLSAFTHHVTTTAALLPVTLNLARERGIPPSKLLMPLSFAASLGSTITLIGAPAFLIVNSLLAQAGRPRLGIFSIAPIGLSLSLMGALYMLLFARFLLPTRTEGDEVLNRFRLEDYLTELTILPDSPFLRQTLVEVEAGARYQLKVVGWLRRGRHLRQPFSGRHVRAGDVLLVHTTPESLVSIRKERGVELQPVIRLGAGDTSLAGDREEIVASLAQAVVAPGSDHVGRTIGEIDFLRRYGVIVLSLWRKEGWLDQELARTKLRAGDVLVLEGAPEALARVEQDPAFLLLVAFHSETRLRRKAPRAGAIMLATIGVAAFNLMALEMATLAGAVAMALAGCITLRQAYRAIDTRIYVFIAGAIPLGLAMQKSGVANLMANGLQSVVGDWNQTALLFVFFAVAAVFTQLMSDAATTALFAPVAIAFAGALGQAPEPYAITVGVAAVTSFLTPVGHHGNLLVYGPGGYQFTDFIRAGAPLTLLIAVVVVVMVQIIWPS